MWKSSVSSVLSAVVILILLLQKEKNSDKGIQTKHSHRISNQDFNYSKETQGHTL